MPTLNPRPLPMDRIIRAGALVFLLAISFPHPSPALHGHSPVTETRAYDTSAAGPYAENLEQVVNWIRSQYDPEFQLLKGARVGGEGLQVNGFSIINENQFGGTALQPYEPELSRQILGRVAHYLNRLDYGWNGRREVLVGGNTPLPIWNSHSVVEIEGARQSQGGAYWIVTELPRRPLEPPEVESALNKLVPTLLQHYKNGNRQESRRLFEVALSLWDGTGFREQAALNKGKFFTRAPAYFLYAAHATGFPIEPEVKAAIEAQLWRCQVYPDGSIVTVYGFDGRPGEPIRQASREDAPSQDYTGRGHTSLEIMALTTLIYDPRLDAWFAK